jgi:dipeptidyl aminopeptidase/acylaminoacyl peptidase
MMLAALAFSLSQVLSYPLPTALSTSADGRTIVYAIDQQGKRSVWIARAPQYQPRAIVTYNTDDGQSVGSVQISADGSHLVYVHGNSENPSLALKKPEPQIYAVDVATGAQMLLGTGGSPTISPDGTQVAFISKSTVWGAPIDGHTAAKQLFYDQGKDSDLQWQPRGNALAFVSSRGDHSFIGVYRGADRPLQFLAPSVHADMEPRWSPDGARIAFARTPGDGGAPQSPLKRPVVPWSLMVARVSDGSARAIWRSPRTERASFPTEGLDVDLTWAGNDRLTFISEMDNWPHLYTVSANGGVAKRLTSGNFAVVSFAIARDAQSIYYVANTGKAADDVDRWHLYRVSIAGGGPRAVTAGASSQWWPMQLADGRIAYVTAGAQQPPLVALADANGAHARMLDGALVPADFPASNLVTPREVTYRAPDGTVIHGQLFMPNASTTSAARRYLSVTHGGRSDTRGKPATTKKYPAVIFVHGGPMRQMLLTWNPSGYYSNSYAVNQYVASRGIAVLSVNYRSGVDYGHDFHYALRRGWTGASEYQDVLAGARWLQAQPQIDGAHIGIWGGSWGGSLTALALARNSDVFKAGVDYSGVHDLAENARWYFSNQVEGTVDLKPWLKLGWESSPDASIAKWRSPVLLIQGDDDPDVAFHQLVDLVPRLDEHHVPYQLMVLPDEGHSFLRYASWLKADSAAAAFFERHLQR